MASSSATRFEPRRFHVVPAALRPPSARSSRRFATERRSVGVMEKTTAAKSARIAGEREYARAEAEVLQIGRLLQHVFGDQLEE